MEGIDTEAANIWQFERKVDFEVFLKVTALGIVHNIEDQTVYLAMLHRRQAELTDIAINPDHRRYARRKMQIRGIMLYTKVQ